jgi:PKHD-type hydroxylase
MFYVVADLIDAVAVGAAVAALQSVEFVDGRVTAGWHARLIKHNLQTASGDRAAKTLAESLAARIAAHPLFQAIARPKALSPLILSRYEGGMNYGSHVDDAIMHGMRTDVSFTLFLSDPDSYDGGALVVDGASGEEDIKLPAGSLVAYPSTTLHRVSPVTRGQRFAAVGWGRSYVRDAAKRELLFDLDTARQALFAREGKTSEFDLLSKSSANLLRMWAED